VLPFRHLQKNMSNIEAWVLILGVATSCASVWWMGWRDRNLKSSSPRLMGQGLGLGVLNSNLHRNLNLDS
jgi:hypothetical protein